MVTTAIILDTRRAKANGTYPVKLRVTFDRKRKYYATEISLTESDFKKVIGAKPRDDFKKMAMTLSAYEAKAAQAVDTLGDNFTFLKFDKEFRKDRATRGTLFEAFNDYIGTIEAERPGTISYYECARNSFRKYNPQAMIKDVSVKFLTDYESWMIKDENSVTTVGMYCRALRSLINSLIADGSFSKTNYPFGSAKHKLYEIPTSRNIKKALTFEEISLIVNYECSSPEQQKALDYWYFLCMANGINVADFCRLKRRNIDEDTLSFVREKTKRTKRDVEAIEINILPEMRRIIDKYGAVSISKDAYIFPIITSTMSPAEQHKAVQLLTRSINYYMGVIAASVGIKKPVTSYTARHSFATLLQNSGRPVAMISQMLGHSSPETTKNYLGSFEEADRKEATTFLGTIKKSKNAG